MLVFQHVTVIDVVHGRRLRDQTVVIAGTRIHAIGQTGRVQVPAGAQVIDAEGQYLIPGLWDMHTHVAQPLGRLYAVYLANGVTGIRDAGSAVSLDTLRAWRQAIIAGTRIGPPRQIFSGRAIEEVHPGACARKDGGLFACVTDTADARHLADSLAAAGANIIKPRDVSRAVYVALAAEARRLGLPFGGHAEGGRGAAWQLVYPFWEHVADGVSVGEASDLGARIIDHQWGDPACQVMPVHKWAADTTARTRTLRTLGYRDSTFARCRADARRFRRNDTWFVPTIIIGPAWFASTASEAIVARFDAQFRTAGWESDLTAAAHGHWLGEAVRAADAGESPDSAAAPAVGGPPPRDSVMSLAQLLDLPLLAGTDLGSGVQDPFALHVELALLVTEGLSPLNALRSATWNPARAFHATDSLGTVAAGKLADLVLLDADPLEDITNTMTIRAVIANGRYYDRAVLDALLRQGAPAGPP